MTRHLNQRMLRIIGGKWRSRKVSFPDRAGIRPTPDRVRETLFNWLAPAIAGARCLELYAGSGILSMEALSRGARHATLVERDEATWARLGDNLALLCDDVSRYACIHGAALEWLDHNAEPCDIVFLDPPFEDNVLPAVLARLIETGTLAIGGLAYIETPAAVDAESLPRGITIMRQKKAGQVHYCLCERER